MAVAAGRAPSRKREESKGGAVTKHASERGDVGGRRGRRRARFLYVTACFVTAAVMAAMLAARRSAFLR